MCFHAYFLLISATLLVVRWFSTLGTGNINCAYALFASNEKLWKIIMQIKPTVVTLNDFFDKVKHFLIVFDSDSLSTG